MKAVVQSPFALERAGIVGVVTQLWPDAEIVEAADRTDLTKRSNWSENVDLLGVDWRSSKIGQDLIETLLFGDEAVQPVIVVLCNEPDLQTTRYLVSLGATAVVPLTLTPSLLSALLQFVLAGGTYFPVSALDDGKDRHPSELIDGPGYNPSMAIDDPALSGLTRRQKEVLRHIANGLSNEEIAEELGVTLNTVKSHVSSMLRALGVKRRTQAMRMLSERAPAY